MTAGGKNVAPAVLEDRIRAHPLVSQCLVVGDGRPYVACLITLDPEAVRSWLARRNRPVDTSLSALTSDPDLIAELQVAVDDASPFTLHGRVPTDEVAGVDLGEPPVSTGGLPDETSGTRVITDPARPGNRFSLPLV